jgi:hypothetical protein
MVAQRNQLTKKQRGLLMAHFQKYPSSSAEQDKGWAKWCLHVDLSFEQISDLFLDGCDTGELDFPQYQSSTVKHHATNET